MILPFKCFKCFQILVSFPLLSKRKGILNEFFNHDMVV